MRPFLMRTKRAHSGNKGKYAKNHAQIQVASGALYTFRIGL